MLEAIYKTGNKFSIALSMAISSYRYTVSHGLSRLYAIKEAGALFIEYAA